MLGGLVVAAGTLLGQTVQAGTPLGGAAAAWWAIANATMGQPAPAEASTRRLTREDVDALLLQAKEALREGDIATAGGLVTQAEAAKVRYPLFHRGDTPKRVRRMVEQAAKDSGFSGDPFLMSQGIVGNQVPNPFKQDPAAKPTPLPATSAKTEETRREQADRLIAEARAALGKGNLAQAERLAGDASRLNVPEAEFKQGADSPARLAWDLQRARYQNAAGGQGVVTAGAEMPASDSRYASQALHQPGTDSTLNQPASLVGPSGGPRLAQLNGSDSRYSTAEPIAAPAAAQGTAKELLDRGEAALRQGDLQTALGLFQQASARAAELDPVAQARVDSHLKMLATTPVDSAGGPAGLAPPTGGGSLLETADSAQQVLVRQLSADVGKKTLQAREMRESEPKAALDLLKKLQTEIETSQLSDEYRRQLVRRTERAIAETEKYINDNRAQIELDEKNAAVLAEIDRERATRLKLQNKKAEYVDKFNRLRDEHRYREAELVAKQLYELMPNDEIALMLWQNAKFLRREFMNREMKIAREEGTFLALQEADMAATPNVSDGEELVYDQKSWDLLKNRKALSDRSGRKTQREIEIEQKLKMPVQLKYTDRPLSEVIEGLSQMTGVNIHLDQRGLNQEGVSSDTPITIDLNQEVMLKSALNLILEQLHLSYIVKDEVLKITSEQLRDGEIYPETYYVADLVTPIPNFVPSNNIGLQGLINDAHAALGHGSSGLGAPGPMAMVQGARPGQGDVNQNVLAQVGTGPQFGGASTQIPLGGGGPSPGGGANADFDSLIDLIISTVASESWAENGGGEAEIRPYVNNLSLVVSQTQAVHEQIADLLDQLRRLQDLQITVEVRFIRLNDSFFERIGIDFDVNINDKTVGNGDLIPGASYEPLGRRGATVGINAPAGVDSFPAFTSDLDIPFRQDSFGVATPAFGGPVQGAATFGFAILSDIEAYFLVEAAQGDSRTNILNAPKVTLFNGQTAFVADASQTPFVISVIPVVGEFAAAQQPVIVVLSEGTLMNIQAVVSDDRRYVRMTVVPFFSEIGDVQEFTFEGSSSTSSSSSSTDADDDGTDEDESSQDDVIRSGTTVQLPTFQFVSVSTTVSVPDGGTVLLGGIKRLNEGRNEVGVPLLSKVPYINRLFRNVGIGRETESLMLMVTPRIIIQEEEEEKLGIALP